MPNAREIGVLTFHRCINYGSYWQAWCLTEGLRRRGHDAVLLDHHSARINRAEWRCALAPIAGPASDRARYAAKARKFFSAFARMPLSPPFALDDAGEQGRYDLVVVGSDEVWNLKHPWYGGVPLFYGEGTPARRLASYAASFGNHSQAEGLEDHWVQRLARFARLSVRDANSRALVARVLGYEPTLVLDPCLQFSEAITYAPPSGDRAPYLAIYGHSFPRWFQQAARDAATAGGLRLVSIGYRNDWADDQWIEAGPEEFAAFIAGASAVATNFFHGCIFALINGKPFVCVLSDYRQNKVADLVAAIGAGRHMALPETPAEHYRAILADPPDCGIASRIAALRQQSEAYLDDLLA